MTCRVARLPQDLAGMNLVYCCECGSANLEVFHTSRTLGPHLCPTCAQSKIECGAAESMARSPRRGRVQACAASLEKELQSTGRT
jgi:hypothetical protein